MEASEKLVDDPSFSFSFPDEGGVFPVPTSFDSGSTFCVLDVRFGFLLFINRSSISSSSSSSSLLRFSPILRGEVVDNRSGRDSAISPPTSSDDSKGSFFDEGGLLKLEDEGDDAIVGGIWRPANQSTCLNGNVFVGLDWSMSIELAGFEGEAAFVISSSSSSP